MAMVHPTTDKTISSYKRLMHDPTPADIWKSAFGKDFGVKAQGDIKTGQKGTNSIIVMTHVEIANIPKNQIITYASIIDDYCPQKADPHQL
jgi:hypothetical protein